MHCMYKTDYMNNTVLQVQHCTEYTKKLLYFNNTAHYIQEYTVCATLHCIYNTALHCIYNTALHCMCNTRLYVQHCTECTPQQCMYNTDETDMLGKYFTAGKICSNIKKNIKLNLGFNINLTTGRKELVKCMLEFVKEKLLNNPDRKLFLVYRNYV